MVQSARIGNRMDQTAIGPPGSHPAPSSHEILQEIWREIVRLDPEAVPVMAPPASAAGTCFGTACPPALPALLALDDAAFIAAAYDAVLGRVPDEAGIISVQAAMARGFSKIAVLGSLQRSPEGRATGRIIPGLRARALAHGAYRLPVLGGVARLASAIVRRSGLPLRLTSMRRRQGLDRDARLAAMDGRLASLEALHLQAGRAHAATVADQQARIDALARKVAALVNEHVLGLDRLAKRLDAVNRQMAALDETLTDPLVSLADGLEAQRRAILQVRADLAAELRRTLEGARPALPTLTHQVARQA